MHRRKPDHRANRTLHRLGDLVESAMDSLDHFTPEQLATMKRYADAASTQIDEKLKAATPPGDADDN